MTRGQAWQALIWAWCVALLLALGQWVEYDDARAEDAK